mgnify:CR=1 FL=1
MDEQRTANPDPLPPVRIHWVFWDWFWFLLKNLIGWVLILVSGPVGLALPGPGGIPIFLIGFALITLPGKRRFTARALRGKPIPPGSRAYQRGIAVTAILLPVAALAYLIYHNLLPPFLRTRWWLATLYMIGLLAIWLPGMRAIPLWNRLLGVFPRIRRRVRPWMRKRGIDLLPPRRRRRRLQAGGPESRTPDDEILEIHERHHATLRAIWAGALPWLIRLGRLALIGGVFWWMLKPVFVQWDVARDRILATNWWHFALAAVMFSVFLFAFRAITWRRILIGFGHRLPVAPATRIWSMSELARYIPGVIWQVVGRVYLSRPYGVSGSVSSASQILELSIFMLANILVGMVGLAAAGVKRIPPDQRQWVIIAMSFAPVLLVFVHPRIFYGLLNALLRRLGKPQIAPALGKRQLTVVALWNILGLFWQALAIWILTYSVLELPIGKWYVLAGSYCLAWTIGFSVGFLAPGGIGIREAVFITTLRFALPPEWVQSHFADPNLMPAFLGFVAVLLRLWAMSGELIMAGLAIALDYRGFRNRPDAPGRVAVS